MSLCGWRGVIVQTERYTVMVFTYFVGNVHAHQWHASARITEDKCLLGCKVVNLPISQ